MGWWTRRKEPYAWASSALLTSGHSGHFFSGCNFPEGTPTPAAPSFRQLLVPDLLAFAPFPAFLNQFGPEAPALPLSLSLPLCLSPLDHTVT